MNTTNLSPLHFSSVISKSRPNSVVVLTTNYNLISDQKSIKKEPNPIRLPSLVGSDSYNRSLRRAFNRAKLLAFFNPDMTNFITFTYSGTTHTPEDVMYDIKQFIKKEKRHKVRDPENAGIFHDTQNLPLKATKKVFPQPPNSNRDSAVVKPDDQTSDGGSRTAVMPKYIWVLEWQKRKSLHVHMIANDFFQSHINEFGHRQLTNWKHGFTNVQTLEGTDENFKPYLYLFKYMNKTQRIGKSFVHVSRGLEKITHIDYDKAQELINGGKTVYKEVIDFILNEKPARIIKEYISS